MAFTAVPPWLNINPLEPVDKLLSGYGQGRAAGAGRLSAEQNWHEMVQRANLAAQQMAFREAESQREQEQFNQTLRLRQEAGERAAMAAAMQLQGYNKFREDMAAGLPIHEAIAKNAPELFFSNPSALPGVLRQTMPQADATQLGEVMDLGQGITGVRVSPKRLQVVSKPRPQGGLTDLEKSQLMDIRNREKFLASKLTMMTPKALARAKANPADPLNAMMAEMEQLKQQRMAIYGGGMVKVKTSDGREWSILRSNLPEARRRDPGLVELTGSDPRTAPTAQPPGGTDMDMEEDDYAEAYNDLIDEEE